MNDRLTKDTEVTPKFGSVEEALPHAPQDIHDGLAAVVTLMASKQDV